MTYIVGPKGQVTIAKEIRDRLSIEPGWVVIQRLVDDHVEVYFLPPEHRESLKGSLAEYVSRRLSSEEELNQARRIAWARAVTEDPPPPDRLTAALSEMRSGNGPFVGRRARPHCRNRRLSFPAPVRTFVLGCVGAGPTSFGTLRHPMETRSRNSCRGRT